MNRNDWTVLERRLRGPLPASEPPPGHLARILQAVRRAESRPRPAAARMLSLPRAALALAATLVLILSLQRGGGPGRSRPADADSEPALGMGVAAASLLVAAPLQAETASLQSDLESTLGFLASCLPLDTAGGTL